MRNSFPYVRTECIYYIKLLINVYFLQIKLFLIKKFLVRILFTLIVYEGFQSRHSFSVKTRRVSLISMLIFDVKISHMIKIDEYQTSILITWLILMLKKMSVKRNLNISDHRAFFCPIFLFHTKTRHKLNFMDFLAANDKLNNY